MKYSSIIFIIFLFPISVFSQKNTFYVSVPSYLKEGTIIYDLHPTEADTVFHIIFNSLHKSKKGSGFMFLCNKAFSQKEPVFFSEKKILSPENVVDSLNIYGRTFFRNNNFFVLYKRGTAYYTHKAKGEYLYWNQ